MVEVNFGLSPIDAFNMHLTTLINSEHIQLGTVSLMVSILLAIIGFIIIRNKDVIFSIIIGVVLGLSINLFIWLYGIINLPIENMLLVRLLLLSVGILLAAVGVIFTTLSDLPPSPFDNMMVIINYKTKSIFTAKLLLELGFLLLALFIGFFIDPQDRQLSLFSLIYVAIMPPIIALLKIIIIKGGNKNETVY